MVKCSRSSMTHVQDFDHGPSARLSDPMAQRHLFNEIDGEAVKT